jgi:hypothetical protein
MLTKTCAAVYRNFFLKSLPKLEIGWAHWFVPTIPSTWEVDRMNTVKNSLGKKKLVRLYLKEQARCELSHLANPSEAGGIVGGSWCEAYPDQRQETLSEK